MTHGHGPEACCPECPGHWSTDGLGFPHPSEARGRRVLQRCKHCGQLAGSGQWMHDIPRAFFGCADCASKCAPDPPAPRASRKQARAAQAR